VPIKVPLKIVALSEMYTLSKIVKLSERYEGHCKSEGGCWDVTEV
jgi:hypothetical protein